MIEQVIKDLNKSMKLGNLQLGVEFKEIGRIPFSSCRLNYMTYGGVPVGRVTEFCGVDGSGKTTSALDLVGQAQKKFKDKKVLFVDIEHTFDSNWAKKLGVDIDNLLYFDPDSSGAEEVFNAVIEIIDSGEISLCVLDSIGAMVSGLANEKKIGEKTYGGISQALTEFSKKITPVLARTDCAFIGINQVRDDLNSPYGGKVTTGGHCWGHACSVRMEFRKGNYIDEKGNNLNRRCENPAGNIVECHIIKSKVNRLDRKVGFYTLNYLEGIDYVSDLVDVAVKYGIINKAGAWLSLVDIKTGEVKTDEKNNEIKFQGKPSLVKAIKEDKNLYKFINEQISICGRSE